MCIKLVGIYPHPRKLLIVPLEHDPIHFKAACTDIIAIWTLKYYYTKKRRFKQENTVIITPKSSISHCVIFDINICTAVLSYIIYHMLSRLTS